MYGRWPALRDEINPAPKQTEQPLKRLDFLLIGRYAGPLVAPAHRTKGPLAFEEPGSPSPIQVGRNLNRIGLSLILHAFAYFVSGAASSILSCSAIPMPTKSLASGTGNS